MAATTALGDDGGDGRGERRGDALPTRAGVPYGNYRTTNYVAWVLHHVQASFNNTIVTVTDVRGRVVSWASAGTSGFRGTRKGTPYAAQATALNAIRTVSDQGMQRAEVMIKGPGLGRDAALRAIRRSGMLLSFYGNYRTTGGAAACPESLLGSDVHSQPGRSNIGTDQVNA
ncbi:hypothetical protein KSP39_PZI013144 [Platanthera zijinensis]|uniref:Ribosomal protein S11 n=1 Tax=Platanthera zijinensis TaxID=2320716 RepID=A0AAP0BDD7_9ASPA